MEATRQADGSWGALAEELGRAGPGPARVLRELDQDPAAPAADVLLGLIQDRDEEELCFRQPPAVRRVAVTLLLERRLPLDLVALTRHLRSHRFYEGETDEVAALTERLHGLALRPYLGLDGVELVVSLEQALFGRDTDLDAKFDARELQDIRLVAYAAKQLTAFQLPPDVRTLRDLGEEILDAGR